MHSIIVASCLVQNVREMSAYCKTKETDVRFKQCSKCKFFQYCSITCQQKYWNEHKSVCQELSFLNEQNKNNQFHKGTYACRCSSFSGKEMY